MKRIFYSDYGEDPLRMKKIEAIFTDLRKAGVEVCRTSRKPVDTVALNLVLPSMIERSAEKAGVTLHPNVPDTDVNTRRHAATFSYDHPRKSEADCFAAMHMYRQYIEQELSEFRPDLVVLWHQFNAYHYTIFDWCNRENVPIIYCENGVLPGSWCFEYTGQMGESWIATNPEKFKKLPIGKADADNAQAFLKEAVASRANRKNQGITVEESGLRTVLESDPRPKILYAGNNDFKAGLKPFSARRSRLHAADFVDTEAGLNAILPIARKNGWHVLFKPHPSVKHSFENIADFEDCLTIVDKRVDLLDLLSLSDVLATIVSQSAYMSLIHSTPVVLMGRMQLTGSGLVEEAPYVSRLEKALKMALKHTVDQRALLEHVARLLRYYVVSSEYGECGRFYYDLADVAETLIHAKNH